MLWYIWSNAKSPNVGCIVSLSHGQRGGGQTVSLTVAEKGKHCHWYVLLSEKASAMGKLLLEMIQPSSVCMLNLQNTP